MFTCFHWVSYWVNNAVTSLSPLSACLAVCSAPSCNRRQPSCNISSWYKRFLRLRCHKVIRIPENVSTNGHQPVDRRAQHCRDHHLHRCRWNKRISEGQVVMLLRIKRLVHLVMLSPNPAKRSFSEPSILNAKPLQFL